MSAASDLARAVLAALDTVDGLRPSTPSAVPAVSWMDLMAVDVGRDVVRVQVVATQLPLPDLLRQAEKAIYFGRLPWLSSTSPLVPGTGLPPTWVLVVTAVAAVLLGLLCVRWMAAQLARRPKSVTWRLENDPARGNTTLAGGVAVEPLVSEITGFPGVHAASATLAGQQGKPTLVLTIRANQDADLGAIRRQISQDAIPRLRQALELPSLPVRAEFRYTSKTGPRAL